MDTTNSSNILPKDAETAPSPIVLISWNVAGWSTTVKHIESRYKSVSTYFDLHQADIVCIQEVKVSKKKLMASPMSVAAILPNWDTFHSCCSANRGILGYSGTTTYARVGLTTKSESEPFSSFLAMSSQQLEKQANVQSFASSLANVSIDWYSPQEVVLGNSTSTPLIPDPPPHSDLNEEGRLVITYHKNFALFNVYMPNSGVGYSRLPYKMRFLHGIRAKMLEVRARSLLPIVLVGDFNATYRSKDCCAMDVLLDIRQLWTADSAAFSSEVTGRNKKILGEALMTKLQNFGPIVERYLRDEAKHCLNRIQLKYKAERGEYEKADNPLNASRRSVSYRYIFNLENGRHPQIGKSFDSEEEANLYLSLNSVMVYDTTEESKKSFFFTIQSDKESGDSPTSRRSPTSFTCRYTYKTDTLDGYWIAREKNRLSLQHLMDCFKALQVTFTEEEKKQLLMLSESHHARCIRNWLISLLEEDGMVDSFAEAFPSFSGRFTVWDQSANKRYTNEGTRLDYILMDRSFYSSYVLPFGDNFIPRPIMATLSQKSSSSAKLEALPLQQEDNNLTAMNSISSYPMKSFRSSKYAQMSEPVESDQHALNLATSYGRWKPAPYDGSGLADASEDAYLSQFSTCGPHIGMIYTAPKYSDHIAVSCIFRVQRLRSWPGVDFEISKELQSFPKLLRVALERNQQALLEPSEESFYNCKLNSCCEETRKAQPHKQWRSIQSFFAPLTQKKSENVVKRKKVEESYSSSSAEYVAEEVSISKDIEEVLTKPQEDFGKPHNPKETDKSSSRSTSSNLDLRSFFKRSKTLEKSQ